MKRIYSLCALLALGLLLGAMPALANHFAGATLTWSTTGSSSVRFALTVYYNRTEMANSLNNPGGVPPNYTPQIGDILNEGFGGTQLFFGDASNTPPLKFQVTAIDPLNDIVTTVALDPNTNAVGVPHTYSSNANPILAWAQGCCRINASLSNNRIIDPYRLETVVQFDGHNGLINTTPLPIIKLCEGPAATFTVSASNPDAGFGTIRYRLATNSEATDCGVCGSNDNPPIGITGASINPTTGVVTWNTVGLSSGNFYTVQFIAEKVVSGNVYSKTPIDFLLKIQPCDVPTSIPTIKLSDDGCWPPNHKMKNVHVTVNLGNSYTSFTLLSVSNSELDNGLGDGNTVNDIQGATLGSADQDFQLRCERSGKGSGRVYTIIYRFFSPSLPPLDVSATYGVPHDQSGKKVAISNEEVTAKSGITLNMNYPNPFTAKTDISYTSTASGDVSVVVYDAKGELVRTLFSGQQSAGSYSYTWDGHNSNGDAVPSGTYFYKVESGDCGCGPVRAMTVNR